MLVFSCNTPCLSLLAKIQITHKGSKKLSNLQIFEMKKVFLLHLFIKYYEITM